METLAGRVAFRLARLGFTSNDRRLRGRFPRQLLRDLFHGRLGINENDLDKLSACLGIARSDLTRDLTPVERSTWAFYIASAHNHAVVWNAARSAWRAGGFTDKAAASLLGLSTTSLSKAVTGRCTRILDIEGAAKLADALGLPSGPESFLPPREDGRERD